MSLPTTEMWRVSLIKGVENFDPRRTLDIDYNRVTKDGTMRFFEGYKGCQIVIKPEDMSTLIKAIRSNNISSILAQANLLNVADAKVRNTDPAKANIPSLEESASSELNLLGLAVIHESHKKTYVISKDDRETYMNLLKSGEKEITSAVQKLLQNEPLHKIPVRT